MLTTSFFGLCFSQTSSFYFQDFSKAEKKITLLNKFLKYRKLSMMGF